MAEIHPMLKILIALFLLGLSFLGGVSYERFIGEGDIGSDQTSLSEQAGILSKRNQELEETVALVKRQIQADRIAYQRLRESVESAHREQEVLRKQLKRQRELLESLQN